MTKPVRTGFVARWMLPSIGSFCLLLTLYLLVVSSWRFLLDSDTGWHIRTGEMILRTGAVPRTDPFSHTLQGREWYAWEWLADVGLALAHDWRGLSGVVGSAILVLLAGYAILYQTTIARGADPLLACALTIFAALCCIVHWLARPHLFSILLLAIWLAMIEAYRRRRSRLIWVTPPLLVLWANLHGGFAIVFALLGVYCAGDVAELLRRRGWRVIGEWREWFGTVRTYTAVGLLSVLAALATPYGFGLYRHIWRYLSDNQLLSSIQEFQSPNFHLVDGKLIELLLLFGGLAAILAWRQGRVVEAGLFILWAHLTLQSERHVTLAAVTIAPIIAEQFSLGCERLASRVASGRKFGSLLEWYRGILAIDRQVTGAFVYLLVLVFIIFLTGSAWADKLLSPHFSPKRFPVDACSFILREQPSGKGYSHDQFGGYLIYRLYPHYQVFVDGRSDFYRQGTVLEDMEKVSLVKPEWATRLDQYEIKWLLLRRDEPLSLIAQLSGKWRTIYEDSVAQVLVRN